MFCPCLVIEYPDSDGGKPSVRNRTCDDNLAHSVPDGGEGKSPDV